MGKKSRRNNRNNKNSSNVVTCGQQQQQSQARQEKYEMAASLMALPLRNNDHTIKDLRDIFGHLKVNQADPNLEIQKKKVAKYLNPEDDVEKLESLLKVGTVLDARTLAKAIPKTIEDWNKKNKNNKIAKQEFFSEVIQLYEMKRIETSIMRPLGELATLAVAVGAKNRLMIKGFCWNLFQMVDTMPPDENFSIEATVKLAVDNTCRSLNEAIERDFLEVCPVYDRPTFFFREILDDYEANFGELNTIISPYDREADTEVFRAILEEATVAKIAELKRKCWECGKAVHEFLMECSACNVAAYCGQACQKKAWKAGHNEHCNKLPQRYQLFQQNCKVHLQQVKNCRLPITLSNRSFVFGEIVANPPLDNICSVNDAWRALGPSLEVFYKNISRIEKGEFWICAETESMDLYLEKRKQLLDKCSQEQQAFDRILTFLCYEFEHRKSGQVAQSPEEEPYLIFWANEMAISKLPVMPVERFLYLCDEVGSSYLDSEYEKRKTKWHTKAVALYLFREWAHKG